MKKMMLATALLALTAGGSLAQDVVRIGTEGAYEPYNYIDQATGELTGYEIELGNELCKRASLNCEFVQNAWDSIIPNLQSGNYDMIMAGMSITDEREEVIDFSQNYIPPASSAYLALTADANVGEGAVVAAQTGTIQAGYVAESGATLLEFATPDETVAAVRNGEADAVFADKDYLAPIAADSNGEVVLLANEVQLGGGVGIGMRETDTELKEKMNAAIQSMKDDGTLNTMITKWFGPEAATF
ncbi:MAG: transporter substrate-binding domain-containing protein [Fuscovulum sp.]|jgi:polar amino acid transport system substrate-binding protein|nr:transporter substrate-binding domain-containing protein [Paracoccaceae bacterium]MCZ8082886.1 transporter substrate-binding domain-containing protein [Paracoccaceae bacterium]WRH64117.1 MAG: transporter substrate-binding domain-containing protein [Fuscovulum sp.]